MLAVVVEDEWSIRMQIADTLADAGWEVEEFVSAELAIEFLDQDREVKFLVTDIRLTGTATGWDVAEAYRTKFPDLKIVYCSGNTVNLSRQVSQSEFMAKPCEMRKILSAAQGQTA